MRICLDCQTPHAGKSKNNYCRACQNKRSQASRKKYNARCAEARNARKGGKLFCCPRCGILVPVEKTPCEDCQTGRLITYADAANSDRYHLRRTIEPTAWFE